MSLERKKILDPSPDYKIPFVARGRRRVERSFQLRDIIIRISRRLNIYTDGGQIAACVIRH